MGARAAANGRDGTNAKADADAGLATEANGDANAASMAMPMPMPPTMYPPTTGQGSQQYYYAPPPPPVAKKSSGSDVPAWMWVGLGVALATVVRYLLEREDGEAETVRRARGTAHGSRKKKKKQNAPCASTTTAPNASRVRRGQDRNES